MALIDKASLLMVPSVYEDGTLYNVLPSGNKAPDETGNHNGYDQTRADFTFSRGFNLAATRVNANGLIEKGRENLLTYSNDFSNSDWEKSDVTITSGFEGYDGTNNAWELTRTATAYARMNQAVTQSGLYTHSIYAKAGTLNWISIGPSGGGEGTWFNLSNGTIGVEGSLIKHSSIESIGNGWYRISVVVNNPINQWFRFYPSDVDGGDESTTATGTIYVQNAQLEYGLAASSYLDSGATTATAGVLENTPRIDYSSGAGALLLESQRTNLVAYSEVFDLNWLASGRPAVETNVIVSPEGVQNGSRLSYGSGNVLRYQDELTFTNGYTYSIFVKKDVGRYVTIYAAFFTTSVSIGFDLDEGTCQAGGVIEPYADGWYRISVSKSVVGDADKSGYFYLYSTANLGDLTSQAGNKLYVYGAQIEDATHVSSYVPTYGSAATRGADSCSVTGVSDVIGQTEGTLYVEYTASHEGSAGERIFAIGDGTSSNRIVLFEATNKIRVYAADGGAVQWDYVTTIDFEGTHKIAVTYAANNAAIYIDGTQLSTDTSFVVPNCGNVYLGTSEAFGVSIGGSIKEAILFDSALTQSEAEALTTL